jgi:Zn-finger protein
MKYDNPNNHEHCLICYWTIFKSENGEDGFGYYYDGSTWLCTECYAKFISKAEL